MIVYYKNDFLDSKSANIDVDLPHFRYGAGLFETALYDGKVVQHLDRHIDRLCSSSKFFGYKVTSFDYPNVINQLVFENGLTGQNARVNVCHLAENGDEASVFISVNPYTPPAIDKVFQLCHYPKVHDSYLSQHKTMNYMHFIMAKKYAVSLGCDDALLVDSDGYVLETSTAAVVLLSKDKFIAPKSPNKLASITLDIFIEKNDVVLQDTHISDIGSYEILLMNSLMGVNKAIMR